MKSLTGKFTSVRGWGLLLALLLGAGLMISACGDEEVPTPTTPAPPPPAPTPTPTPPPTPEPTGPATPANLRVSGTTSDSITWTWDAVEGVLGYQGQFSTDTTFTDIGQTALIVAPMRSHTVSGLQGNTTGNFRVRSGTGTSVTNLEYSEWSAGSSGTTAAPPTPPPATALSAPTGLRTGSETTTTVALTWSSVDDADSYDVEQRPADGQWTGASCNGGDSQVNSEACEASGLARGTDYSFRVRAQPDPDDDTREESAWSSTASARTSGSTPSTPITSGDDDLNITWESDATSITWFWQAASDTRITNLYALLAWPNQDTTPRPACPGLEDAAWKTDMRYAIAHNLTAEAGEVHGLCVRRSWEDDQENVQYGPVSVAWAATSPAADITTTLGAGRIEPGLKGDAATGTTAIDWYFNTAEEFEYVIGTVSAIVGDDLPSCDSALGNTSVDGSGGMERFRLSKPAAYTQYRACAHAKNVSGASDWQEFSPHSTRPAAPPIPTLKVVTDPIEASTTTVELKGTFSHKPSIPEEPGSYAGALLVWTDDASAKSPSQSQCDDGSANYVRTVVDSTAFEETGSGFAFSGSVTLPTVNISTTAAKSNTVYACVKATAPNDGPWVVKSAIVKQLKDTTG